MRIASLVPATLLTAALALPFATAARASVVVDIDKNAQSMSVSVDGTVRYVWPVSTGRPGYDTPNGVFKPNRMDADHFSQEWDNAPMPHAIFFDSNGHAIHGYYDTKNIGRAASHGCVRLSPANAATLFTLVKEEGLTDTRVIVSGETPAGRRPEIARRRMPVEQAAAQPMQIAPGYGQQGYYGQQQGYYVQGQPYYGQQQTYYRRPAYGQPVYQQPQPQFFLFRPFNPY